MTSRSARPLHAQSLRELGEGLRAKDFSARELAEHFLARIERFDGLNAVVTVCSARARAEADAADARLARGDASPLLGIPLIHKDLFCTTGLRTACGSKMLDNFISPYDATVVTRLREAGAVLLAKANMDEFAMGSSNENSYYGAVHNPWAHGRVPGGSSGGSAASVAAGLAPLATATDTGGSIRQPAALCGITGIKPTYGRVSRYGMVAFASSLDQGGAMARSAEDAAWMLEAMSGFDPKDSTSFDRDAAEVRQLPGRSMQGLKIGLPKQAFGDGIDDGVETRIREALSQYEQMGATLVDIELPHTQAAISAYYVVAPAEASSNLSRFDGVRYGHRCENPENLEDLYRRSRSEGFGPEVRRRIMLGTFALSTGYYDAYYLKAQQVRQLVAQDFSRAYEQVDVIAAPTSPMPAFGIGTKAADPIAMYLCDVNTVGVSLAGLPSMSHPAGFVEEDDGVSLPVGVQLTAPYFAESLLLDTAHAYQQVTDWHRAVPAEFED